MRPKAKNNIKPCQTAKTVKKHRKSLTSMKIKNINPKFKNLKFKNHFKTIKASWSNNRERFLDLTKLKRFKNRKSSTGTDFYTINFHRLWC